MLCEAQLAVKVFESEVFVETTVPVASVPSTTIRNAPLTSPSLAP